MKLANSMLAKITPQSKHFAVTYHWFREKLDEFGYEILPVRTDKQKADMFTKAAAHSGTKYQVPNVKKSRSPAKEYYFYSKS